MGIDIALAIQARTSSVRFPEKVLSPLRGAPMLLWTINYCRKVNLPLFVLTSTDESDDQLIGMLEKNYVSYYRGSLENVVSRYLSFMKEHQVKKVVRISGDSPLINPDVILKVIAQDQELPDADLTTNVFPRSFPKGQSVEVIPRKSLELLRDRSLSESDIEHVTPYFYANYKEFKIYNRKVPGTSPGSYTIDHTAGSYAFDPEGRLRLYIKHAQGPETLAHDLNELLK